MSLIGKPVSASATNDQTQIVFPNDLNSVGTLFGGRLIERADLVAAVVAKRHAGLNCLTLGIDSVRFLAARGMAISWSSKPPSIASGERRWRSD